MEVWIRPSYYYLGRRDQPMPFPVPGWMWDREIGIKLYDDHMRLTRRLDELGFDGVIFTEHHYGPNGGLTPSPLAMLAAATQITERIKLVTMGIPLALYPHPVRVAEELAMLDNLSHGRLVVGFISSGAQSLYAYNVPVAEERQRYHEACDLVVKAWTDENPFEWRGKCYNYDCVSILPRPLQVPHPPIWTTASSAESIQWAAQQRIRLIASGTVDASVETLNYYQTYAESECGWSPTAADRGIAREFYIAPTLAEVEEKADEIFQKEGELAYDRVFKAPRLAELHRDIYSIRTQNFRKRGRVTERSGRSRETMQSGRFLVGDPDSLTEQILHQRGVCGANVFVGRPELGAMSMDQVISGLELFAREVLPAVQKA